MSKFNAEHKIEGSNDLIVLGGHLDEDANLDTVSVGETPELIIDFNEVTTINSCGIREWIKWIKTIPTGKSITYVNCPKIIVDQVNMVSGFIPENGKIKSFYVPYYCENTDSEKMILFTEGKEFSGSTLKVPDNITDDNTGEEMEMDVIKTKYFKFLK